MRKLRLVLLAIVPATYAQPTHPIQQFPIPPRFEVATIKPCGKGASKITSSRDRLTEECVTLEDLIRDAYCRFVNGDWQRNSATGALIPPAPLWQMGLPIKGSAGWVRSQLFTINAKSEGPATMGAMEGPMMRALLEERFLLKIHSEKQEVKVPS